MGTGSAFFTGSASSVSSATIFCALGRNCASCSFAYSTASLLIVASRSAFDAAATSGREMTAFRASRKMTIATGSVGAFGPPNGFYAELLCANHMCGTRITREWSAESAADGASDKPRPSAILYNAGTLPQRLRAPPVAKIRLSRSGKQDTHTRSAQPHLRAAQSSPPRPLWLCIAGRPSRGFFLKGPTRYTTLCDSKLHFPTDNPPAFGGFSHRRKKEARRTETHTGRCVRLSHHRPRP
jgi:hypothetical protein